MTGPYCDKHNEVVERGVRLEGKMDALLKLHGVENPNKVIANNPHLDEGDDYVKICLRGRAARSFAKAVLYLLSVSGVIALILKGIGVW